MRSRCGDGRQGADLLDIVPFEPQHYSRADQPQIDWWPPAAVVRALAASTFRPPCRRDQMGACGRRHRRESYDEYQNPPAVHVPPPSSVQLPVQWREQKGRSRAARRARGIPDRRVFSLSTSGSDASAVPGGVAVLQRLSGTVPLRQRRVPPWASRSQPSGDVSPPRGGSVLRPLYTTVGMLQPRPTYQSPSPP
jgi:hypothetical protein